MQRLWLLVSALLAAAVTCRAAPALDPVTCADDGGKAAARMAMHTINEERHHGYRFKLDKISTNTVEKVEGGCNIELTLVLQEADCHVVEDKHFEDCNVREMGETMVTAECNVSMTVGTVNTVTKYHCDAKQAMTNDEIVRLCPDCPTLIALNDAEGLKSVRKAVDVINKNTTNPRYFVLMEVGRMSLGYMMMSGMNTYADFALVESHCPMGTRIVIEACVPLCPDRARHAFCKSSYARSSDEVSVDCEFYPPKNTTVVDLEPKCGHPHRRPPPMPRPGPPPFDTEQRPGPPPHAGAIHPFHPPMPEPGMPQPRGHAPSDCKNPWCRVVR